MGFYCERFWKLSFSRGGGGSSLTSCLLMLFSYPSRGKKLFLPLVLRPVRVSSVFCSTLCLLQFFPYNGASFAFQKQPCCQRPVVDVPMFSAPGPTESDPVPPQWPCSSTPTTIARLSPGLEVPCCLALPSLASAARRPYTSLLSVLLASPP